MTWAPSDVSTTNLDAGTDLRASARPDLLDLATKFNQIRNHVTSFAQTLLDDVNASDMRTTLGVAIDYLNTTRIDVASATTTDLTANAPNTRHINITGTTAITGFTVAAGLAFFVRFNAALTLTNNASIITQTGANITTAAGDTCLLRATAANTVEVLFYTKFCKTVVRFDALTKRNNTSTLVVANNTITSYSVAASTFTENTDTTGVFNPSTGVFTVLRSGVYKFSITGICLHTPSISSSAITAYGEIGGSLQGAVAGSFSGNLEWDTVSTRGNMALVKFNTNMCSVVLAAGDTVTFTSVAPTFFNSVGVSVTYSPSVYSELAQQYNVLIEEL